MGHIWEKKLEKDEGEVVSLAVSLKLVPRCLSCGPFPPCPWGRCKEQPSPLAQSLAALQSLQCSGLPPPALQFRMQPELLLGSLWNHSPQNREETPAMPFRFQVPSKHRSLARTLAQAIWYPKHACNLAQGFAFLVPTWGNHPKHLKAF